MAFGLLLLAAPLKAEAVPETKKPAWLTYEAPTECPQADFIEEKVTAWLKGPIPADSEISAQGEVRWADGKWEVTVDLESRGARGLRRVAVDHCVEAAEFVAVTVVLALDPSFVASEPLGGEPDAPAPSDSPNETSDSKTGNVETAADDDDGLPPKTNRRPHFLTLESSLIGVSGIFPEFAWGVSGSAGWQIGIWEFRGGISALPTVEFEQPGASSAIAYSLLSGSLGACARFSSSRLHGGPCLAGWVGEFGTSSVNVDGSARQTQQLWASVNVGARGGFHLGPFLDLFAGAHLSLPLTQPSFLLDDQATEVHRPGLGVLAELGLRFAWPFDQAEPDEPTAVQQESLEGTPIFW